MTPRRTQPKPPELLTVAEVADHLRVDAVTVRRMIGRGDFRAVRVGREWRIAQAGPGSLTAYLEQNTRDLTTERFGRPEELALEGPQASTLRP
jgi:excisionase family DNA binding protein